LNSLRNAYETDLTDAEWEQLAPLVPVAKSGGRPPKHSRREILNGIFSAVRSGGAWKPLPHDLPPWRTVYHYFWLWRRTGVWQQIHDRLREQVREAAGRNPKPSAAILDSQSIRTSEAGGVRGYDGGQKIRGRKRHILVDTLGLLLLVVVTAANVQDRNGAQLLLSAVGPTVPALAAHLGR
jgi:putative transposase